MAVNYQRTVPARRYAPRIARRAKKVGYQARMVGKIVRSTLARRGLGRQIELKHFFTDSDQVQIPSSLSTTPVILYPTTQGVTPTTFVGHKITCKYLKFNGMLYNGASSQPVTQVMRVMIVEDLQPVAGVLYLNSPTHTLGYEILRTADIWSPPHMVTPSRFRILYDESWNVPFTTVGTNRVSFQGHINLKNATMSFTDGAVSGNYAVNRAYYLYVVTSDTTSGCWVTYHVDLAYTDD